MLVFGDDHGYDALRDEYAEQRLDGDKPDWDLWFRNRRLEDLPLSEPGQTTPALAYPDDSPPTGARAARQLTAVQE